MKQITYLALLALATIPSLSFAQDGYQLSAIKPEVVFTPKGFDSNDNAQVVLYGRFSDVCHRVAQPSYSVDQAKHRVYIQNRVYTKPLCVEILVSEPYTVVINLDALPKGNYDVFVSDDKGIYSKTAVLPIAQAKSPEAVDDYLYAQINYAQVSDPGSTLTQVTVRGTIHNTCLGLKDVSVSLSPGNVYDVLPIMEITHQANCQMMDTPFEKTVTLSNLPAAPALLNIRSAGGQSIEKVIDQRIF